MKWSMPWAPDAQRDPPLQAAAAVIAVAGTIPAPLVTADMAWAMVRGQAGFTASPPDDADDLMYVRYNWQRFYPAVPAAAPVLSGLSPSTAVHGAGNTTVTLSGTGFLYGAVALSGTQPLATTFVSAISLSVIIPTALLASAGTLVITVKNPDGQQSTSQSFTVS